MHGGEYRGVLLGESLELDAVVDVPLGVHRVTRHASGDPDAGQPRAWTFIEFSVAEEHVDTLANTLKRSLRREGGWYCDFHSDHEVVVVFCDRVFRYPPGDRVGRAEAERHARTMGVPESQLDWAEP